MTIDTILVTAPKVHAKATDLLSGYRLVYTDASVTEDALVALCGAEKPVAILARYGLFNGRVLAASYNLKGILRRALEPQAG